MNPQNKTSIKIVFFSIAYGTFVSYLIILLALIFTMSLNFRYDLILIAFLIPSAFSLFFSTNIIRKSLEEDLDFNRSMIKLALAHVPSLIGFTAAMILISL